MSIKAGLNAFLKSQSTITGIVGTRIYHRNLPQNPVYPALVFSQISDNSISHTFDGVSGPWRSRFQIDVYAETVTVVEDLMLKVYTVLDEYTGAMGSFSVTRAREVGLNPDLSFRNEPTLKWIEGRSADFFIFYHRA